MTTSSCCDSTSNASIQFVSENGTLSEPADFSGVPQNSPFHGGCTEIRFSEMEYIPWNNSDNIVTAEVEQIVYRIKNNMLGFLFVLGGPANVINMAVFYKQGLSDRVNLCLFALSLTDGLLLVVYMAIHGEQLYLQFTTKEIYGPIATLLVNMNLAFLTGLYSISPVISAVIALERCYCVLRPLKVQTLMQTRTMAALIIVVYAVVMGLYFIVSFRYRIGCIYNPESDLAFKAAVAGDVYRNHQTFIDFLDAVVFGVGLPLVVLLAVVTSTIITVVKLRQIVTWRAEASSSLSAREVALTKMLVGNSVLFIACVSPIALIRFSWLFFPEVNSGRRHHNFFLTSLWITEMCTMINSSFNIFVYYAMGSRYREVFWSLFRRKRDAKHSVLLCK